jgi:hypothetical protein
MGLLCSFILFLSFYQDKYNFNRKNCSINGFHRLISTFWQFGAIQKRGLKAILAFILLEDCFLVFLKEHVSVLALFAYFLKKLVSFQVSSHFRKMKKDASKNCSINGFHRLISTFWQFGAIQKRAWKPYWYQHFFFFDEKKINMAFKPFFEWHQIVKMLKSTYESHL